METKKLVTFITRTPAGDAVQSIGGFENSVSWSRPLADAVEDVQSGRCQYYVSIGLRKVNLVVAEQAGSSYLKTMIDGLSPANLLALPDGPAA